MVTGPDRRGARRRIGGHGDRCHRDNGRVTLTAGLIVLLVAAGGYRLMRRTLASGVNRPR